VVCTVALAAESVIVGHKSLVGHHASEDLPLALRPAKHSTQVEASFSTRECGATDTISVGHTELTPALLLLMDVIRDCFVGCFALLGRENVSNDYETIEVEQVAISS